jgi:hypothetical protein
MAHGSTTKRAILPVAMLAGALAAGAPAMGCGDGRVGEAATDGAGGAAGAAGRASGGAASAGKAGAAGKQAGGGASSGGAAGKTGTGGAGGAASVCAPGATTPGRAPLKRLTSVQLANALADVVSDAGLSIGKQPTENAIDGFYDNADVQTPTSALTDAYESAAALAAKSALANVATIAGCTTKDAACGSAFVAAFGRRAFRRPLSTDEATRFGSLFTSQLAASNFGVAIRVVAYAMLQSPQFLYMPELGRIGATPKNGSVPLGPWETATRLSFFLTDGPPDDVLLGAAASDALQTPAQVAAQAKRLLDLPRARAAVKSFHRQWLDLRRLDDPHVAKDAATFPQWNEALKQSMRTEVDDLVEAVVFSGDGKLSTLLTTTHTKVDASLASLYGVPAPSGGGTGAVTLDPKQRAGLLTTPALLAGHAHQVQPSPVWRGQFVLDRMLCSPPPPPPANVKTQVDDTQGAPNTNRQREQAHVTDPSCAGCHQLIDGIGLTFESFDAIGRFRTKDGAYPVDTSGNVLGTDFDGPVVDSIEVAHKLATSKQAHLCMTTQWFRYAFGRTEEATDGCTIAAIDGAYAATTDGVRDLLITIASSDAFLRKPAPLAPTETTDHDPSSLSARPLARAPRFSRCSRPRRRLSRPALARRSRPRRPRRPAYAAPSTGDRPQRARSGLRPVEDPRRGAGGARLRSERLDGAARLARQDRLQPDVDAFLRSTKAIARRRRARDAHRHHRSERHQRAPDRRADEPDRKLAEAEQLHRFAVDRSADRAAERPGGRPTLDRDRDGGRVDFQLRRGHSQPRGQAGPGRVRSGGDLEATLRQPGDDAAWPAERR